MPDRAREKALVQRAGQLMYELSVLYPAISGLQPQWAWASTHYETVDSSAVCRTPPQFSAASVRHGRVSAMAPAFAWLAARILLRQYQREPAKGDDLFGFSRVL